MCGSVPIDVRVVCGIVTGSTDVDFGVVGDVGTSTTEERDLKSMQLSTY